MFKHWIFEATSVKLALSATVIVVCTLGIGLWGLARHYYENQIEVSQHAATHEAQLIRLALEHQMLSNDRSLIRQMVDSFATDPDAERIAILDHDGCVQFSSDRELIGRVFAKDSEACSPCHIDAPETRPRTIILGQDQKVLRAVEPIPNREACYECHDPETKINGVLILDKPIGALEAGLRQDLLWMTGATGVLAVLLLLGIGVSMRILVFKRLSRVASAARAIASGNLQRRVEVDGNDEVATLGTEFNNMAASVAALVEDVRYHKARLEDVMSSVDDGLVVLDREFKIVASNDSFARRFGQPQASILCQHCADVTGALYDCNPSCTACPSRRCFETGRHNKGTFYCKNGEAEDRIEEVHASPIFGRDGSVQQVVEVWRDITERRREEARLAEFHKLASVGMLASGFSHEVNTPLATMLACVDKISRNAGASSLSPEEQREIAENAETARSEIERCRKITRQFLKFSMNKNLTLDLVNIGTVIDSVVRLVASTARSAGVTVEVEKVGSMPTILANEGALQHVLLNLVLNAVQASKRGQRVVVSGEMTRDVHIRVRDEGRGIAPEDLQRIFEPFFSLRSDGTGLGLFLSRVMAKTWGGDIAVKSEFGVGSCFEITFPSPEDVPA